MPIIFFHIVDNHYSDEQLGRLLSESCHILSDVLETPIDRTRSFIIEYPPTRAAVGGVPVTASGGAGAPFFSYYMGVHRPREHVPVLLAALTDLIESTLGVDRSLIRGHAQPSSPSDWGVAGVPQNIARASEMPTPDSGPSNREEAHR